MTNGQVVSSTSLERSLDAPRPTPLDALRLAREDWLAGRPLDMGALATRLGTSRATLYRWVGSKERLLGEVCWTFADAAIEAARTQVKGAGPAYIADSVEHYMRSAHDFPALQDFIAQDPEYALKVLTSKHSPMQRRSILAVERMLAEQVEAGALVPALDLGSLAYLIVRIVESFLYSDVITGSQPDIPKAGDAIFALLNAPPTPRRRKST